MNSQSNVTKTFRCELATTQVDDFEQMSYTTYGIYIKDDDGNVLIAYPDISTDRSFVQEFVRLISDHDVALIHVPDLLEDYLAE